MQNTAHQHSIPCIYRCAFVSTLTIIFAVTLFVTGITAIASQMLCWRRATLRPPALTLAAPAASYTTSTGVSCTYLRLQQPYPSITLSLNYTHCSQEAPVMCCASYALKRCSILICKPGVQGSSTAWAHLHVPINAICCIMSRLTRQ